MVFIMWNFCRQVCLTWLAEESVIGRGGQMGEFFTHLESLGGTMMENGRREYTDQ
jgi:hypothetical protein